MSNYKELRNGKVAFHPGYYIEEYIDYIGLTQEDFAKRIGTTPKNISLLIRGEQSLSIDIAFKLSRVMNTSIKYWLNLQNEYDTLLLEEESLKETEKEQEVLNAIDYNYFVEHFDFPEFKNNKPQQIEEVRKFLNISSLTILKNKDLYVKFIEEEKNIDVVSANTMVQIATNISLSNRNVPRFNKKTFLKVIDDILPLTEKKTIFGEKIKNLLSSAGVDLVFIPYLNNSKINGATKKINKHILLMLSDKNHTIESFWFTLFHEFGHIIHGDYGISFETSKEKEELFADEFAKNTLIPINEYNEYVDNNDFSVQSIIDFSKKIKRNPEIIVGRLIKDNYISENDYEYKKYNTHYSIMTNK